MIASILRPALLAGLGAERRFAAERFDRQSFGGDPQVDQVVAHALGPTIPEGQVVFGGATLIAVAFDTDTRVGPAAEPVHVALESGDAIVAELILLEIEEHVAEWMFGVERVERFAPKEFILRQRGRGW
ncbi:MAG TPA: hypothetical protein VLV86_20930 [Vicinamibacterales bacterium]|nr:hypothetical protein [Vicinamibacterales bacterium]